MPEYIVVGGGIAGITITEMLTRGGHSVTLIEAGDKLGGETSCDFHQWLHLGSLYALKPGQLQVAKYILGAIDDLFRYYQGFEGFNLSPRKTPQTPLDGSFQGLETIGDGWFSDKFPMRFNFDSEENNPVWTLAIARAKSVIDNINAIDWERRNGGNVEEIDWNLRDVVRNWYDVVRTRQYSVTTPELQMNSHSIMSELVSAMINLGGADVRLNTRAIQAGSDWVLVSGGDLLTCSKRVIITAGEAISDLVPTEVASVSYAPIGVVKYMDNFNPTHSELNLFMSPSECSNVLVKGDGSYGMIGGYTFPTHDEATCHLSEVETRLLSQGHLFSRLGSYVGKKTELLVAGKRSYLYHIWESGNGALCALPGKFTLSFSLAPEVYRILTRESAPAQFKPTNLPDARHLVERPRWESIVEGS